MADGAPHPDRHEWRGASGVATDDYSLDFAQLGMSKYGALFSEVTARRGRRSSTWRALISSTNASRSSITLRGQGCSVADWQSRLQSAIPGLKQLLTTEGRAATVAGPRPSRSPTFSPNR